MSLLPTFTSGCDLAKRLPPLIASFMDLEASLGRRFREDSLSDLVIAAFLQIPSLPVTILTPNEKRTGSDFDLALLDPGTDTAIQYRIQAKRLGPPTQKWQTQSYRELAHPHNKGGQVLTLCNLKNLAGSLPTFPLYAFYNPQSTCRPAGVAGIALADAFEIEEIVTNALGATPRPRYKQLGNLKRLFFELSDILCPPTGSGRPIATPMESHDAFVEARETRRTGFLAKMKARPIPQIGTIPPEFRARIGWADTPRIERAPVDRPTIIIATGPGPMSDK